MTMKLVEVSVSELADDSREFYWAVNCPDGVNFYKAPDPLLRVHPNERNSCYDYYVHLDNSYGDIKATVWERVVE